MKKLDKYSLQENGDNSLVLSGFQDMDKEIHKIRSQIHHLKVEVPETELRNSENKFGAYISN